MMLFAALHSDAGTLHSCAAAWISTSRAVAPPWRTYSCESRMPRLPPVPKSFHTRLRARFCPGVGCSVVTFDQSHSSSSATSWARPVSVPWPISERAMRITTVSSGRITTQALTSGEPSAARTMEGPPNGRSRPSARPAPAVAVPMTKARRLSFGMTCWFMAASSGVRSSVDRLAHLLEGAAAADIGDGVVDIVVGRLRVVLQQRRHRHDHAALAIAALRHVTGDPGQLHLVHHAVDGEALDGGDVLAGGFVDRDAAGAHRDAVDMDGAGAALCDAATVFGPRQSDILANRPQQGRVVLDVHIDRPAVDFEVCHRVPLIGPILRLNFGAMLALKLERFKSRKRVCSAEES